MDAIEKKVGGASIIVQPAEEHDEATGKELADHVEREARAWLEEHGLDAS